MAFKNDTDPELIARSATVVQAFTPELYAYILSLLPTPETLKAHHNDYSATYAAFLGGDRDKATQCEEHRNAINQALTILSGVAKAVTSKDPKVPEVLRLAAAPTRTPSSVVTLSQPEGFKVFYDRDGNLFGAVTKVESARLYEIWVCDSDPNIESNWRLGTSSSTCRGIKIPGLDHGKSNWFKIRALRGKGVAGPWSNLVNLTPK